MAKTPTWQRSEGKNPEGGLNEKGRASLRAAGHDIKRPQPEGGSRRDSFCARMKGMKAKLTSSETANDPDSRINKSLRKWNCHADGGAVDPYDAVQQASGLDRKKRDFGGFMGSPSAGQTPTQAAIQPNPVMQSSPIPQPQSAPQQAQQQPFNVQAMNTMAFMNPMSGGLFGSPFGRPLSYSASPFASGMSPFGLMNTPETSFMNSQNPYLLNRQAFMPLMPQSSQSQQLPQGVDRNRLISLLGLIYGIGGMGPFMSYKDGGSVEPYDNVQKAAKGGEVWDKPRPKSLGEPEPLSSKQKASAKAAAKAAGRPYPNLVDNMRAARADGGEVWDKPRPKDLGEPKELSSKKKSKAKAMAKAAGRPYPNLIDNMRAARAQKADGGEVDERAHEFVQEQLNSGEPQVPQYVAENDFPARAARGVEAVDTAASKVNNLLADVTFQPAMRSHESRPASEIIQSAMPADPYEAVQQAANQWQSGNKLDAAQTMFENIPQTGMFIGKKANLSNVERSQMQNAADMYAAQKNRDDILKDTGFIQGYGGELKTEISDAGSTFNPTKFDYRKTQMIDPNTNQMTNYTLPLQRAYLPDVLSHPTLYDRYPHLTKMEVAIDPKSHADAYYMPGLNNEGIIGLHPDTLKDPKSAKATLLHETQHVIQGYEDWPRGGSPSEPSLSSIPKGSSPSIRSFNKMIGNYQNPVVAYGNLAGEREAHNVSNRMDLPQNALRDFGPWLSESHPAGKFYMASPENVLVRKGKDAPLFASEFRDKYKYAHGGEVEGDVQFLEDDPYGKVQQAAAPMMAREEYAQRMPVEEPVKYDTGPQPGEAVLRPYEPTIKERIYQGLAGTEERPTPERAQFARGVSELAEYTPVLGNVMAGEEAHRRGDTKGMLMAALPVPGMATEARLAEAAISPAEQAAQQAYQRVLNAQGLYSHGAEAAANLPQTKGTYEQMMAMLKKAGVKPEELRWSGIEKFEGQPVTREELSQHFQEKSPQIQETVYGAIPKDKYVAAEENLYNPEGFEDHPATYTVRDPNTHGAYTIAENHDMSGPSSWEVYTPTGSHIGMFDSLKEAELAANQSIGRIEPTRYGEYTIPGGENYREVVMHLPDRRMELSDAIGAAREERTRAATHYGQLPHTASEEEKQKALQEIKDKTAKEFQYRTELENLPKPYKSSHWEERNPLAHLRMSDRTGPEGEKILHLEELQSDWGQEGRKKGFKGEKIKGYQVNFNDRPIMTYDTAEEANAHIQRALKNDPSANVSMTEVMGNRLSGHSEELNKVPAAPYVTNTQNWTDLGLKRALKEAAEGGYDKMILTPGAEQAARYDLSQQIGSITARPTPDGKISLEALTPDMGSVVHNGIYEPDKIDDLVGKEIADKIRNKIEYPKSFDDQGKPVELTGLDLKVGGEGMKSFYDKLVPTQLQKLVKKLDPDAKVELNAHKLGSGRYQVVLPNGRVLGDYMYPEQARAIARTKPDATVRQEREVNAHVINITPKLREAILSGLPAYKRGGEVVNKPDPYDNVRKAAMISPRAQRASY